MQEQIGRFEIKSELGRGGMGAVYRAWDPELQREVAIKAMEFPPAAPGSDAEANRERFLREARTAARLTHPNIVAVYDVIREGDTAYIVMELIRGSSLEPGLADGPAEAGFAARVIREAADGLDFAHRNGIVHRDIKPANILLDEAGRVKLADFGIARLIDEATASANLTAPGATVGTLGYMPPEQIRGEPVDGRADQFSLGVVAYQLATGRKPFDADTWIAVSHKILNVDPEPASKVNPAVEPQASAAIAKALAKRPEDRFRTCGEFSQAYCGEAGVAPPRKRPVVALVAVVGLLVALGTAAALWVHCCTAPPEEPLALAPPAPAPVPSTPAPPAAAAPAPAADPTRLTIGAATIEFASIPAGRFLMGGIYERDEKPEHRVAITRPFQMGKTEVTRRQWHAVMGGPAPSPAEADLPKMSVSYDDSVAFLQKLNERKDGYRYRLPTEAEWEYAARAGSKSDLYGDLDDIAWYNADGAVEGPAKVAGRDPNAWGLYDMYGNAAEWVADWYGEDYYAESPANDPRGPATGQYRAVRGGAYAHKPMTLRASYRAAAEPNLRGEIYGFRVVREPSR